MSLMWTGSKVKPGVPVSPYARAKREGMAVFIGEEDNVQGIMSRRAAKRESARLLHETPDARTGGWFLVKRNAEGEWEVAR
jgi:hypothetical protein